MVSGFVKFCLMPCVLFLFSPEAVLQNTTVPDTAPDGCSRLFVGLNARRSTLHRHGAEIIAARRETAGLPVPSYAPSLVVAAAEVGDFNFIQHRGSLSSEDHRLWADYFFIKRNVDVSRVMMANIRRVYKFARPVALPIFTGNDRRYRRRGDFSLQYAEQFLEDMLADVGLWDGEPCGFKTVWKLWEATGVRTLFACKQQWWDRVVAVKDRSSSTSYMVCLHVVPEILQMVAHGTFGVVAHQALKVRGGLQSLIPFLGNPMVPADEDYGSAPVSDATHWISFDPNKFAGAAALIRGQCFHADDGDNLSQISQPNILAWLDTMADRCRTSPLSVGRLSQRGSRRVLEFDMRRLVSAVRMADFSRDDAHLSKVLALAGDYIGLPEGWFQEPDVLAPSATTVRRYRFRLDVAYTCLVRRRLRSWIDNDIPFIIVLLFDASPRSGREWLLGEIYIIREDMLEAFEAAMWELADMRARSRAGSDTFDENLAQQLEATMSKAVWRVILTPSCLGAKAAGVGMKFASSIHVLRLLSDGWPMAKVLTRSCMCMCSDLGVESLLPRVEFDAYKLFRHWIPVQDDCGFCPTIEDLDGILGFRSSLGAPGMEHVCHNMEQHCTSKMTHFAEWFKCASHLGKFLHGRFYVDRFAAMCLPNSEQSEWFRQKLYSFKAVPYEKRFGTLVDFIIELRSLKMGLQLWYDPAKFDSQRGGGGDGEEEWVDMPKITGSIKSHAWWARGSSILALQVGVEEASLNMFCFLWFVLFAFENKKKHK